MATLPGDLKIIGETLIEMQAVFQIELFNDLILMAVECFFIYTGYLRHTFNRFVSE